VVRALADSANARYWMAVARFCHLKFLISAANRCKIIGVWVAR